MSKENKKGIYIIITVIALVGAVVPFAAQFILPFFFCNQQVVGAEVWNQYVSIILGIVATITSIVSLILGFKSEEQSNATERRTRDLLQGIETRIQLLSQKQDQILQSSLMRDYSESKEAVSVNLASGRSNPDDEQVN
ncbi:MAG: hypothetical protein HFH65_02930 [Lachnospiraceae bacterium]|nr:hypothetical protein [Lachnospiraceae bacterium]MCI9369274.1 hypothetical protein [Lachnospiraceae bacterium]